jgi:hypothetical protein
MSFTVIQSVRFMARLGISLSIAIGILLNTLSFSSAKTSAAPMSCCDAAGHCNSALMAGHTSREPMCGETASTDLDAITVYAEPDQTTDTGVSVASPCAPDCSSLQWAASVRSKRNSLSLNRRSVMEHQPRRAFSDEISFKNPSVSISFSQSIPRGPPSM